jgi:uncharacterized membrane protein YccC
VGTVVGKSTTLAATAAVTAPVRSSREQRIRYLAFIARCSAAATAAYLASIWVGLPHSVWAAMSALIVSQESLKQTRVSVAGISAGTLIGIAVALGAAAAASYVSIGMTVEIAVGVALCAAVAHGRPALRICMWTCPIILLTGNGADTLLTTGLTRGSEVILGALVGGAMHWMAEIVVGVVMRDGNRGQRPANAPETRPTKSLAPRPSL